MGRKGFDGTPDTGFKFGDEQDTKTVTVIKPAPPPVSKQKRIAMFAMGAVAFGLTLLVKLAETTPGS
jgi:hypothetical protein